MARINKFESTTALSFSTEYHAKVSCADIKVPQKWADKLIGRRRVGGEVTVTVTQTFSFKHFIKFSPQTLLRALCISSLYTYTLLAAMITAINLKTIVQVGQHIPPALNDLLSSSETKLTPFNFWVGEQCMPQSLRWRTIYSVNE